MARKTNATTSATPLKPPNAAERRAQGRAQRTACPFGHLAQAPKARQKGPHGTRDPIAWLGTSNQGRVPELLPLRRARMVDSPFSFYRGAAGLMAHDLAALPHSGVLTHLCGDAHLANFGFFASPERALLFDINDFDESLNGPFDWDLRRLAASFVILAREIGLRERDGHDAVLNLAEAYRDRMRGFATMDTLDAWYYRLTSNTLLKLGGKDPGELAVIRKARRGTVRVFAEEATRRVDDKLVIRPGPSFAYEDARASQREIKAFQRGLVPFIAQYRASLPVERRALFDRYELNDIAVMTPGVGSVGRRCFLLLFVADGIHPLFLQCKEAGASVLQAALGTKRAARPGERVVHGQRLMQAASDIFLGWGGVEAVGDFYVRQLRDMKASYNYLDFSAKDLEEYAEACGYGLARAHAKGGDASTIRGYLGTSRKFNESLASFAARYADVNEADWNTLRRAKASSRVAAKAGRR
jgi:uncharacterized protein (DUF2252 family)